MLIAQIKEAVNQVREKKPVVLNITNYVTMDFMANALLAFGAAPIMSVCDEELEELVKIAHCVNINIGTLDAALIHRCHEIILLAKQHQKPIVLDPVGSGATQIRTQTAQALIEKVDIVRGNASEILSLKNCAHKTRGVDSVHSSAVAKEVALELADDFKIIVVVSGALDFITDGINKVELPFGSPLMSCITGMGCALTAVIAATRGAIPDSFESAKIATAYFGVCGENAAKISQFPGSFRVAFLDGLHAATLDTFVNTEWKTHVE